MPLLLLSSDDRLAGDVSARAGVSAQPTLFAGVSGGSASVAAGLFRQTSLGAGASHAESAVAGGLTRSIGQVHAVASVNAGLFRSLPVAGQSPGQSSLAGDLARLRGAIAGGSIIQLAALAIVPGPYRFAVGEVFKAGSAAGATSALGLVAGQAN